jgi:hypothetical protein
MSFVLSTLLIAISLCLGMVGSIEAGYRTGKRSITKDPDASSLSIVDSSVFGILGLLLAFTFTGALGRFDDRRALVVKEANAIGTAYLRLDLLDPTAQRTLRPLYRDYLQARIELYQNSENEQQAKVAYDRGLALQNQIWQTARSSVLIEKNPGIMSLTLGATNDVIDITNERLQASRTHPPSIVYIFLFALVLSSAFLVGYNMAAQNRRYVYHTTLFCVIISATIYVILDLEYPRRGLFQIDTGDRVLLETLETMN